VFRHTSILKTNIILKSRNYIDLKAIIFGNGTGIFILSVFPRPRSQISEKLYYFPSSSLVIISSLELKCFNDTFLLITCSIA
jgi:hypothetical protein